MTMLNSIWKMGTGLALNVYNQDATNVTLLTTTAASIVAAPASGRRVVTGLFVHEYAGATPTITLYKVPSGGSAANATEIFSYVMTAEETVNFLENNPINLRDGDAIYGKSSADSQASIFACYSDEDPS